jgi:hypothetical protein
MKWIKISKQLPPVGELVWVWPCLYGPTLYNSCVQATWDGQGWGSPFDTIKPRYWHPILVGYDIPPKVSNPEYCPECQSRSATE